jgi:MYXO-CTERM domain-containing protein
MTESERSQHHVPPDPSGIDEPHDVLAAEEFGIGTRENRFPGDPTGIREPHDVLAAEEFAMPAGVEPHDDDGGSSVRALLPLILAGLVVLIALRRRR